MVLKHPEISGLIVTMKTASDIELYLKASGAKFTAADQRVLDKYASLYSATTAGPGAASVKATALRASRSLRSLDTACTLRITAWRKGPWNHILH